MESKLFRLKRIKAQIWRFFPVSFIVLSLVLIVLTMTGNSVVQHVKQGMFVAFEPIVSFISEPVYWLKDGVDGIKNWSHAYSENKRLMQENEYLLKWRSLALQLFEEQKELKKHLNYVPPQKTSTLLAKIVLDDGNAFSRSFVVAAGQEEGVVKGMLAFTPKGIFGRVIEVMKHYSRVMPVTDYLSRIPVWIGEKKVPALLLGDNTTRPYLQFLQDSETVQKGDIVVTSGYVGVYPSGLVIGEVSDVYEDEVRVSPYEDGERLIFVRLVDFKMNSVLLKED